MESARERDGGRSLPGQQVCPYCRERLGDEPRKAACPSCQAWMHDACAAEHGACAACGERDLLRPRDAAPGRAPPGQPPRTGAAPALAEPRFAWSGVPTVELTCPDCRQRFRLAQRLAQVRTRCDPCLRRYNNRSLGAVLGLLLFLGLMWLLLALS